MNNVSGTNDASHAAGGGLTAIATRYRVALTAIHDGLGDIARDMATREVGDEFADGLVQIMAAVRELEFLGGDIERLDQHRNAAPAVSGRDAQVADLAERVANELKRQGVAAHIAERQQVAVPKKAGRIKKAGRVAAKQRAA
jgi:hypothetical protein